MAQKHGLGKGLSALIPGADLARVSVQELPLADLGLNPFQPRKHFNQAALEELASTIRDHGILTPVVVRRVSDGFQIVAGERRIRAARLAGLTHVPAIIRDASDSQALQMALVENLQREDLNPLEAAEAYQRLVDEFGLTQEELAGRLGRDRSSVANSLRLLRLPIRIRDDVAEGTLSEGHARALLGLERAADQLKARDEVVRRGLNVRGTEALVRRLRSAGAGAKRALQSNQNPNISALEDQLRTALGTRVKIVVDGKGGTLQITYFSSDDLTRIADIILGSR
jgi:ParB family transcriptional regulator, chromosome partitioning protein